MQVFLDLFLIMRTIHGDGCHTNDGIHGSSYIMTHAGQKFLFGCIGLFCFFPCLFSRFARRIHFSIHMLQFGYLFFEYFQIL